jgi:hypothetical protein
MFSSLLSEEEAWPRGFKRGGGGCRGYRPQLLKAKTNIMSHLTRKLFSSSHLLFTVTDREISTEGEPTDICACECTKRCNRVCT